MTSWSGPWLAGKRGALPPAERSPRRRCPPTCPTRASAPARSRWAAASRPTTKSRSGRSLEIEAEAESALEAEPERRGDVEDGCDLEEDLQKTRIVEHQIDADRTPHACLDAVRIAVAPNIHSTADADVP